MKKVIGIICLLIVIGLFSIGGSECGKKKSRDVVVGSSYTPRPSAWVTKTPMPTPRAIFAAGVVNDKIYCIGGINSLGSVTTNEEYNPISDTWITKAPMPTARRALTAGVVDNKIYVIGGYDGTNYLSTVEEYNPASDTWTTKTPMPVSRTLVACGVFNNKIYVVGGVDASIYYGSILIYDPASDTWISGSSMTDRFGTCAGVANNKIFVVGGSDGTSYFALNEVYEPGSNLWVTANPLPATRSLGAIGVINNMMYYIGGENVISQQGYSYSGNYLYNSNSNEWTEKQNMLTSRTGLAIGVVNNKLYAIGGGSGLLDYLAVNEEYNPALDP